MSYGASIYNHVYNSPITAEVLCGISREQGWRPSTMVKSAPSQLEIETQLVADRLLRECFTRKSPRRTGRIDPPDTHPRSLGEEKIANWDPLFSFVLHDLFLAMHGREERYLIVACTVISDVPEAVGP
jgi:hypothetical protein